MTEQEEAPQRGSESKADSTSVHQHGHWDAHDHLLGMHGHIHDPEHDSPFHTHPGEPEVVSLSPEETGNRITLTSVGIDVGSTTSHLVFSRLVLERQGIALPSRFKVVERRITHRSPILLTPYKDLTTIDTEELGRFIEGVYRDAGMSAESIDTGATIFTGEAAKKTNAEAIAELFAEQAGKFVSATAGPNLEAVMAAYGSGACARSARRDGASRTVLNIDMGGGTTKFAICRDGEVVDTAAINVGARLVAMDETGNGMRIEPAGRIVAEDLGLPLSLGRPLAEAHQQAMAETLAECVYNVAERRPLDRLADRLMITGPLTYDGPFDAIGFSGGVSEYVYGNETRNFGDLGVLLGVAVAARVERLGGVMEPAEQMIRATVIGAGQYTLQVSGSTIHISSESLLPQRNLQVVAPVMSDGSLTAESVREAIAQAMQRMDIVEGQTPLALALRCRMEPSYQQVRALAEGIVAALPNTVASGLPLILVFDMDIGRAVGSILTKELIPGHEVLAVDEIELSDLEFIDLGAELEDVHTVPVVIKSLVFTTPRERAAGLVHGIAAAQDLGREHEHHPGHLSDST